MHERRRLPRHPAATPISVSGIARREHGAVARDRSAEGMLFQSRSRYAMGERLTVVFDGEPGRRDVIAGHVVRVSLDSSDDAFFHHLTAVRFETPLQGS